MLGKSYYLVIPSVSHSSCDKISNLSKVLLISLYAAHAFHTGDTAIPGLVNRFSNDMLKVHPPDFAIPLLRTYQEDVFD
jgi:hypothetical protein